jgi:hypothetical protein
MRHPAVVIKGPPRLRALATTTLQILLAPGLLWGRVRLIAMGGHSTLHIPQRGVSSAADDFKGLSLVSGGGRRSR